MTVGYEIGWPHPHSHYFDVAITVENPLFSNTMFRIPTWRPGRYVIENFTRNVVSFRAENEHGHPLVFAKLDKDSWIQELSPLSVSQEKIQTSWLKNAVEN